MKHQRLDFWRWMPTLRDLYFDADIFSPQARLIPCMADALEIAFMTGALQALGLGMGYCEDDIRGRCLALQRQAAERLGELKRIRHANGVNARPPLAFANRTVKWRKKQREKRFDDDRK